MRRARTGLDLCPYLGNPQLLRHEDAAPHEYEHHSRILIPISPVIEI